MRKLTSKDGNLKTYFDKIDEIEIDNKSLEQRPIENHTIAANKR